MAIERKYAITEEQKAKLLAEAEFLGAKDYVDTYFDNTAFSLTTQDMWLRNRNGAFQLKVPRERHPGGTANVYEELATESDIREAMKLPVDDIFHEDLAENGYRPFASFITTRSEYRNEDIIIEHDSTDFEYQLVRLRSAPEDRPEQDQQSAIDAFTARYGLKPLPARAKVLEFIRRNNAKQYEALVKAGLIDARAHTASTFSAVDKTEGKSSVL